MESRTINCDNWESSLGDKSSAHLASRQIHKLVIFHELFHMTDWSSFTAACTSEMQCLKAERGHVFGCYLCWGMATLTAREGFAHLILLTKVRQTGVVMQVTYRCVN